MALAAIADTPVDVAIIEVGMGGSWDATNVVDGEGRGHHPPSPYDHERDGSGHELTQIAGEKSGIIKDGAHGRPRRPVGRGRRGRPAEPSRPSDGARVVRPGDRTSTYPSARVAVGGQLLSGLRGLGGVVPPGLPPAARGAPGPERARLRAWSPSRRCSAAEARRLGGEIVGTAFADVDLPGRFDGSSAPARRSSSTPPATRPGSPRGLVESGPEESFEFTRLVGVVGVLEDKDAESVLVRSWSRCWPRSS